MIAEIILGVIAIELLGLIITVNGAKDEISLHIDSLDIRLRTIIDFIIQKMKEIEKKKKR